MASLIDIQAQIGALQKQAEVIRSKDFAATVADIKAQMAAYGITVKDLVYTGKKGTGKGKAKMTVKDITNRGFKRNRTKSVVEIKYRGPNGETWTGRGLSPKWLKALVEQGQPKETFLVPPGNTPSPQ